MEDFRRVLYFKHTNFHLNFIDMKFVTLKMLQAFYTFHLEITAVRFENIKQTIHSIKYYRIRVHFFNVLNNDFKYIIIIYYTGDICNMEI